MLEDEISVVSFIFTKLVPFSIFETNVHFNFIQKFRLS